MTVVQKIRRDSQKIISLFKSQHHFGVNQRNTHINRQNLAMTSSINTEL